MVASVGAKSRAISSSTIASRVIAMAMDSAAPAVWEAFFAADEKGYVLDPSDFSSMFQDSAGTIPVTAVGQPVGRINDLSGNGNHFVQVTDANRPVLAVVDGTYCLEGNGTNQFMVCAAVTVAANTVHVLVSQHIQLDTSVDRIPICVGDNFLTADWSIYNGPTFYGIYHGRAGGYSRMGSPAGATTTDGKVSHGIVMDLSQAAMLDALRGRLKGSYVNGAPYAYSDLPWTTNTMGSSGLPHYLFKNVVNNQFFPGKIFRTVVRYAATSDADIVTLEEWGNAA